MKIKVSDYIVEFFYKNGIDTLFTLTGGFSMHLNDSFGNYGKYSIYYQHHEQASGYSATGYTKTNSKPCIVCTTAGVAASNAISPCLVAYQDSLPILFISGQSKSMELTRTLEKQNPNISICCCGMYASSPIVDQALLATSFSREAWLQSISSK